MIQVPLRSWMVTSVGAAIVDVNEWCIIDAGKWEEAVSRIYIYSSAVLSGTKNNERTERKN